MQVRRFSTIRRMYRRLTHRCVVCGRSACGKRWYSLEKRMWYCSYTCAMYDGTFNLWEGWLGKKPSYFEGHTDNYVSPEERRREKFL